MTATVDPWQVSASRTGAWQRVHGRPWRNTVIGLAGLATVVDSCRWLPVVHPDCGIARAAGHSLLSSQALQV